MMTPLSPGSIETLIDLVEIKLSMILTTDGEARREQRNLLRCLNELKNCHAQRPAARPAGHDTKHMAA